MFDRLAALGREEKLVGVEPVDGDDRGKVGGRVEGRDGRRQIFDGKFRQAELGGFVRQEGVGKGEDLADAVGGKVRGEWLQNLQLFPERKVLNILGLRIQSHL